MATKRNYSCAEEVLYTAARSGYLLCRNNLAAFTRFDPAYSSSYLTDAEKAVDDAEALVSIVERNSESKMMRLQLKAMARGIRADWQLAKRYTVKAFRNDDLQAHLEALGIGFYNAAADDRWTSVNSMVGVTNTFVTRYKTQLEAKGLPTDFQQNFMDAGAKFKAKRLEYIALDDSIELQADAKVKANNAVYETLIEMLKDSQKIVTGKLKRIMTFNHLKKQAQGTTPCGFKGYIYDADGFPLPGAVVMTKDGRFRAVADERGRFHITRMENGEWTFVVSMGDDYVPVEKVMKIKPGVTSHMDFTLERVVMAEAA